MRLFPLFLFFFIACQVDTSVDRLAVQPSFFDLKAFFDKELSDLKNVRAIQKKVIINDHTEEKQTETFNLVEELTLFTDADINKPTWWDQYHVDTTRNEEQQLATIQYKARKQNLKVKQLTIYFEQGEVTHIVIQKSLTNIMAASSQELTYYRGKGYSVQNKQSLALSEPKTLYIDVSYIK